MQWFPSSERLHTIACKLLSTLLAPGDVNIEISSIDYRLITFDVDLAPTLVGFMAFITDKLANSQVSVLPFGAYSKDHIFVSTKDFEKAMDVLQNAAIEAAASESKKQNSEEELHSLLTC